MAEFQAGEVVVPVVPDATGFIKKLERELVAPAIQIGRQVGANIQRGIQEQIRNVSVEVSADTARATGQVAKLRSDVQRLSGSRATVQVDADAAAANAAIAGAKRELDRIDGRKANVRVDVDAGAAAAKLAATEVAASRLDGRNVNIDVKADVSAALAAISSLGIALGALAAIPVGAAIGGGLLALAGPLAAAGAGFAGLAAVAIPTVTRINEAVKQQEQATKAAAASTASGAVAAAQAASQAATLAAAEQRVTDAKRTAKQAEEDLTKARQDAKRAMEDLAQSVKDAALQEEDAALSVEEAQQRLNEVLADPTATDLERRRAELNYKEAVARLEDQTKRTKRLKDDQAAADKAGIEGSPQVVAAKEKIREASQRVADAERALKVAQLQAAASAAQAQQASAGLTSKLSDLSPAAKIAAGHFKDFKDAYLKWQEKLEPAVLPVITGGLKIVQGLFKPLTPLIKGSADALADLEKGAAKALGGKFWTDFFKQLSDAAPKAISGLGKSFGNIATGVAGIIKAFLPFTDVIVGGIQKATGAFANFGKGLSKSKDFQAFIAYAKENAPRVWEVLKNIAAAAINIVKGLAPLGGAILTGLSFLAKVFSQLDAGSVQALAIAIGSVVLAVKLWTVAQTILNVVLSDNPIGLIILAIGALVAGLIYAWNNSETFRNVVMKVWEAISTAAQWAWTNVIQPVLAALVAFWQNVIAPAAMWLWNNVIVPAWQGISAIVVWAWTNVIQPALQALWAYITNVVAPTAVWLWNNVFVPAFQGIATVVQWAWKYIIQPNLILLKVLFTQVIGPVAVWLWKNVFVPAFQGIAAAVKSAWTTVIKPTLDALVALWKNVLAPAATFLWKNVIVPTFQGIGTVITGAWNNVIKPVLNALVTFITKTVPDGFKTGVDLIGKAWALVKDVAKAPVKFIVDIVYNNGIVKVWNAVADILGLKDKKLAPLAFASGGIYPGYTPGKDVGYAAVSGGEAIMRPEWTRAVGENYVHGANAAARSGGVGGVAKFLGLVGDPGGFAGAFAGGGIIGDIKNALAGGIKLGAEKLLNPLLDQASQAMGNSKWAQLLVNAPRQMVKNVLKWIGDNEGKAGGGKALAFARAQIGKPYKWGATGPDAYDCSGLTMRAWQAAGVKDIPRVSEDQINWVKPVTKPVAGDLGFPHSGHVWMYTGTGKIVEAAHAGTNVREVAARPAQVMGRPPSLFDAGGYLMPGTSLVHNGTGRPEPVLTDQQWRTIQGGTRGGDGPAVQIENFNAYDNQTPGQIADEFLFRLKARG